MKRFLILLIIVLPFSGRAVAQNYQSDQESYLEAEYFMMLEEYRDALPYYQRLLRIYPDNYNLSYKTGVCYLHIRGEKNLAIDYLEDAARNSAASYREGSLNQKTAPYESWYYLGIAYRINYQFERAIYAFERFGTTLMKSDTENILFIEHQIQVCRNAGELMKDIVDFTEENLGELFNDSNSNFNPVISTDGKSFAYMTSLKFYDAIFFSRKERSGWSNPVNITPDIQSDGNMYVSSLSSDGSLIFLTRISDENSDIFVSRFDGTRWSPASKLNNNINTRNWESHAAISPDGKSLIFASDRPGGYGGLDLYVSFRDKDGEWGPPLNLGPDVNTQFNEDRPALTSGGSLLFFCSQGHFNMGGYDIFKSKLDINGQWGKPENPGYPFNTPDDEVFYMPVDSNDGYMPLHREGKGYGKEDIYFIKFH
ncbi:MAG: hypothetical protein ABR519_11170 [Bacteroidales bacterium]